MSAPGPAFNFEAQYTKIYLALIALLRILFPVVDGRNHVPCCVQEGIPDICQDVCQGEYTPITDNIKTMVSCSPYTEQTLACIVDGIGNKYNTILSTVIYYGKMRKTLQKLIPQTRVHVF